MEPKAKTKGRTRKRVRSISVARALAMLRLLPVNATPMPRIHVAPSTPDRSSLVFDRPTGTWFVVYTPRFRRQFESGHRVGLWYVRPAADPGAAARSLGFPTRRAALEALQAGRHTLGGLPRSPQMKVRVIWESKNHGEISKMRNEIVD